MASVRGKRWLSTREASIFWPVAQLAGLPVSRVTAVRSQLHFGLEHDHRIADDFHVLGNLAG